MLSSVVKQRGVNLIEILIALAVLSILLTYAYPSFTSGLRNTQVRGASESILGGLQLARAEAMRLNTNVMFTLTTNITAGCAASNISPATTAFVISQTNPAGACNAAASPTVAPQLIQANSLAANFPIVLVNADAASVTFNGLGRVVPPGAGIALLSRVNLTTSNSADRALRIEVSLGGRIRLCDPLIVATTDNRICGI